MEILLQKVLKGEDIKPHLTGRIWKEKWCCVSEAVRWTFDHCAYPVSVGGANSTCR